MYFEVLRSTTDDCVFHFVEVWSEDATWFNNVQIKKDYYKPYWEITNPMCVDKRVSEYERLTGWSFVDDRYLQSALRTKDGLLDEISTSSATKDAYE